MRTTLTIDDDIAVQLERLRRRGKGSLKEIVNDLLRRGLQSMEAPSGKRRVYRTRPVRLGRCLVDSIDDISEALALAEGEDFR